MSTMSKLRHNITNRVRNIVDKVPKSKNSLCSKQTHINSGFRYNGHCRYNLWFNHGSITRIEPTTRIMNEQRELAS